MIGHITKFYSTIGVGIIASEDGRKFRFHSRDLANRAASVSGVEVDFEVRSGRPRDIISLTGSPWSAFGGPARR
jgi:hypothetical protein